MVTSFLGIIVGIVFLRKDILSKNQKSDIVTVAFIDSVCSIKSSKEFSEVVWNNTDEIVGNEVDDDKNGYVDDINGWNYDKNEGKVFTEEELNHCDYVLHAFSNTFDENVKNVNYDIMILNVLGSDGECSTIRLIEAINYAESNGAQICNLSLSTYNNSDELRNVIEQSEMLFIVAAGNESEDLDKGFPSYPTNYNLKNVISVAATDKNNCLLQCSNYGRKTVDVAMNGVLVYNNDIVKGTSIATGKLTAVASIIYGLADVRISAPECKEKILSMTEKNVMLSKKIISQGVVRDDNILKMVIR